MSSSGRHDEPDSSLWIVVSKPSTSRFNHQLSRLMSSQFEYDNILAVAYGAVVVPGISTGFEERRDLQVESQRILLLSPRGGSIKSHNSSAGRTM